LFLEGISGRYINANPYHNWLHAVDVAHCTYQMMIMCKAKDYFSVADRFALLIAATCHDVGHPGLNNPFLVESDDPLALTYNDKSPLENLHSSIMFEYAYSNPQTAILHRCSKAIYMTIRKVAIEAILHTDMINHFPMVSELKLIHEDNPDVIAGMHEEFWNSTLNAGSSGANGSDKKAAESALNPVSSNHPQWDMPPEAVEFWNQPDKIATMRNLILHAADVSNPFKPFPICRAWAYLVLEEFFQQGDREKSLGLTVQLLNDRDKVKKCQSQIGFIEYVVCPLYFAFATIMPPMNTMAENLINNCRQWEAELIEDNTATQEEQDIIHQRIENIETNFHESQSIFEF
jgi:cAMP-specific phosphodiesterase 4